MTVASTEEAKPVFTQEQRHALGRVYSFLIELGRKRLRRLAGEIDPVTLAEDSNVINQEIKSAGGETKLPT